MFLLFEMELLIFVDVIEWPEKLARSHSSHSAAKGIFKQRDLFERNAINQLHLSNSIQKFRKLFFKASFQLHLSLAFIRSHEDLFQNSLIYHILPEPLLKTALYCSMPEVIVCI